MADQVVFEGAKMWLMFLYIIAFMVVGAMFFQMSNINAYKNSVNMILEREGGYTESAYEQITSINREYRDQFSLEIVDENGNVLRDDGKPYYSHIYKFGEKIHYQIKTELSFLYLKQYLGNDGKITIPLNGFAYSHSREANT